MEEIINLYKESRRLAYRKINLGDSNTLYESVKYGNHFNTVPLREIIETNQDAIDWVKKDIERWSSGKKYTMTICLKTVETKAIGQVSIQKYPEVGKWALAFWMHPEHSMQGYTTEAVNELVKLYKNSNSSEYLWAGAHTKNLGSNKVLEKCGFDYIETINNGCEFEGEQVPIRTYEMKNR